MWSDQRGGLESAPARYAVVLFGRGAGGIQVNPHVPAPILNRPAISAVFGESEVLTDADSG